jgi:DNA-binding MarR family transcriptional regulator
MTPAAPPADRASRIDTGWADAQVGYLLRRATAAMTADYAAAAGDEDLRPVLVTMLTVIADNPGTTQSELGAALGIHRSNVAPLVAELVDHNLVDRRRSQHDSRCVGLHLSDTGQRALVQGHRTIQVHESRMTSRLTPAERAVLLDLLGRIVDAASISPPPSAPPLTGSPPH